MTTHTTRWQTCSFYWCTCQWKNEELIGLEAQKKASEGLSEDPGLAHLCSERREIAGKGGKKNSDVSQLGSGSKSQAQEERLSLDKPFSFLQGQEDLGIQAHHLPLRSHLNKKPHRWLDHDRCKGVRNKNKGLVKAEDGWHHILASPACSGL